MLWVFYFDMRWVGRIDQLLLIFGVDLLREGAAVLLYPSKTWRKLTAAISHEDQIAPAEHIRYKTLQDGGCSGYISLKVESFVNPWGSLTPKSMSSKLFKFLLSIVCCLNNVFKYSGFYCILSDIASCLKFSGLSLCDRKIADPAFLSKLLLDQALTIGCSVWWEVKNRKERYVLYLFI